MPEDYLKDLIKLSTAIFDSSEEIILPPSKEWVDDILRKEWFWDNDFEGKYITQSPGWYWIGCDVNFEELKGMELIKDKKLPNSACKVKELANSNYKTFGDDYLCSVDDSGSRIIYNGHQENVISRIRQHFTLNNENTGALGLKYYPMFQKKWVIRFFGKPHISRLESDIQKEVRSMIEEKSGRIAIENAWRAKYGWPILCKA